MLVNIKQVFLLWNLKKTKLHSLNLHKNQLDEILNNIFI